MSMATMSEDLPQRPAGRQDFKIAIICAMTLEADMVEMILDKDWADDKIRYGKAPGDTNAYTAGVIAHHNVILAYCPTIGSNSAAQVATSLGMSFTEIEISFVVGVCGVTPYTLEHEEIVLGDCIVSTAVVQFDLGQRGPAGFKTKNGLDGLGRAGRQVGSSLAKLMTRKSRLRLSKNLNIHLQNLAQQDPERVKYPGCNEDKLFTASYTHCHRATHGAPVVNETCIACDATTGICRKSCVALQCEDEQLVSRNRLTTDAKPNIHFGQFGSSNTVLKSGLERDAIADINQIIAFEMEGSGVWNICPTIVVKAACDYADSHKNKRWQPYAAAVAASTLKSLLQELEFADEESTSKDYVSRHDTQQSSDSGVVIGGIFNHGFQGNSGTVNIHNYQQSDSHTSGLNSDTLKESVQAADNAIRAYYKSSNNLKIIRLSGEELSLDKCYINLALVDLASQKQNRATFSLTERLRLDATNLGKSISIEALFEPRRLLNGSVSAPRRIFIQGRAGIGKTTLCKKLVYEFLDGQLGQDLFDRLLWIPLRRLKHNKADDYNWQQLIQDAYSLQGPKWERNKEVYSEQLYDSVFLNRTLLLFDGLDEVSQEWSNTDNVRRFLESVICDSPNVIITSRPHAKALSTGQFDLELETVGFLPDQIDTYLENCAPPQAIPKMKLFMAARPLIQGLLRIPIQLDAFCCAWKAEGNSEQDYLSTSGHQESSVDQISTMTQLYWSLSLELCRKDMARLAALYRTYQIEDLVFSQLPEESLKMFSDFEVRQHLKKELRFLGAFAFQGMVNNIVEFTPKFQNQIMSYLSRERSDGRLQLPIPYNSVLEVLSFLRSSDIGQDTSKRHYHFLHLTFQEFFAAQHYVEHWQEEMTLFLLVSSTPQQISPLGT